MIIFDIPPALIIGLLVSTILPLLVGLVTKVLTSPGLRAVILAALAAATGLLTELGAAITAGVAYNLGNGLIFALTSFLVAVGLHFGIYKPTGAAVTLQAVGDKNAPK